MKKLLVGVVLMLSPLTLKAETIHVNLGSLQLDLPFQTVSAVGLWDFVHKEGDAGLITPFAEWKHLVFNGGAITSLKGHGAPLLDVDYVIKNPAENFVSLAELSPGVFAGYDFNAQPDERGKTQPWIIGLKLSAAIW